MQIVIDIPQDVYDKALSGDGTGAIWAGYVKNGIPLDKIRAEILDEAEYAYADFDRYKEDILCAEPDELPDDDFRYGLERAVEIINKYKAESEPQERMAEGGGEE